MAAPFQPPQAAARLALTTAIEEVRFEESYVARAAVAAAIAFLIAVARP
jgi:hypothetical protein